MDYLSIKRNPSRRVKGANGVAAINARTASGLVREYCRKAQPAPF